MNDSICRGHFSDRNLPMLNVVGRRTASKMTLLFFVRMRLAEQNLDIRTAASGGQGGYFHDVGNCSMVSCTLMAWPTLCEGRECKCIPAPAPQFSHSFTACTYVVPMPFQSQQHFRLLCEAHLEHNTSVTVIVFQVLCGSQHPDISSCVLLRTCGVRRYNCVHDHCIVY
eukprot:TRINITY_DN38661_c0_g1_i1.p1 TRINITY_DN38661_c0_g1~~TRINITY_DN38661_c0_g1_i1.p1  ORF type:complete len:169 (-),score=13.16 TRINITY_DN38661_c0_g1_i1:89-595(-)